MRPNLLVQHRLQVGCVDWHIGIMRAVIPLYTLLHIHGTHTPLLRRLLAPSLFPRLYDTRAHAHPTTTTTVATNANKQQNSPFVCLRTFLPCRVHLVFISAMSQPFAPSDDQAKNVDACAACQKGTAAFQFTLSFFLRKQCKRGLCEMGAFYVRCPH